MDDTDTLRALRCVVNEKATDAMKQMEKDSEELASLKKQLPILFLTDKDKGHHGRGHFYYFIDENDENPDKCDACLAQHVPLRRARRRSRAPWQPRPVAPAVSSRPRPPACRRCAH